MHTPTLDEIVRQKEPGLKKAVELLSKGRARDAVELLIKQDRGTEIENPQERMRAIAEDYCAKPGALVICLRNAESIEQNRIIHSALQDAGKISREGYETSIYVSRDITGAERKFAGAYQVGDSVRYNRGSKQHGIKPREYWEVVRIDQEKNQLTVLADDGRRATYDPRDTEVRARDLSRADWNFALLSAARGSTASEISEKLGIGEQANIIQSSGLCSKSGVTQNPEYDSRISIWRKLQKPYESLRTFLQI